VPGTIGPLNTSPTSTYFFGIHGLVETLYERWQRGKLKDGPYSNLIFRNYDTGTNTVATVSYNTSTGKASVVSQDALRTVAIPNSCSWYVGAVADFDYDGNNDIVWHGPGCTNHNTHIWKMNATNYVSDLPNSTISDVDNTWTLIGAQDFNQDLNPDIVWSNKNTNQVVIWFMVGSTFSGYYAAITMPSGFNAQLVADAYDTPVLLARNFTTGATQVDAIDFSSATAFPVTTINSPTADVFTVPIAAGHFHTKTGGAPIMRMDVAWVHLADNSTSLWTADNPNAVSYADHGSVLGVPTGHVISVGPR
jgi:hypothetical protein